MGRTVNAGHFEYRVKGIRTLALLSSLRGKPSDDR